MFYNLNYIYICPPLAEIMNFKNHSYVLNLLGSIILKIFKRITSVALWKVTLCFPFCCPGRLQHSISPQLQPSLPVAASRSVAAKHVTSAYVSPYNADFCRKISGILRALICRTAYTPVNLIFAYGCTYFSA